MVNSTAARATSEPAAESNVPRTLRLAIDQTRSPTNQPSESPKAAAVNRTVRATVAWPRGEWASPASGGASKAPTSSPTIRPA